MIVRRAKYSFPVQTYIYEGQCHIFEKFRRIEHLPVHLTAFSFNYSNMYSNKAKIASAAFPTLLGTEK